MKEIRKANIILNKDGHGSDTSKISLPIKWIRELNFNINDKQAIIEIFEKKIIIRKKEINMLLIKEAPKKWGNSYADYELENGILLFDEDWNGEIYGNGYDPKNECETNTEYIPIYRFELDNINTDDLKENSDEWNKALEIIGFEEQ